MLTSRPAHLLTSPDNSQEGTKGRLDRENGNSLRALPSARILSLKPLTQQHHQQQQKQTSPPLSSLEKEAVRTRGRPLLGPSSLWLPFQSWYLVWRTFNRMGDRKHKVVRHLDFYRGTLLLSSCCYSTPAFPMVGLLLDVYVQITLWQPHLIRCL